MLEGSEAELQYFGVSVAERYHDDHRLRLPRLNEVVEDKIRAAHGRPPIRAIAVAMQQEKNGIRLLGVRVVVGRRVDVKVAVVADDLRMIEVAMDHAVRILAHFPGQRSRAG